MIRTIQRNPHVRRVAKDVRSSAKLVVLLFIASVLALIAIMCVPGFLMFIVGGI